MIFSRLKTISGVWSQFRIAGWALLIISCCFSLNAYSQAPTRSFESEFQFARHLSKKGFHSDALFQLQSLRPQYSLSTPALDSLNYLTGWSFYEIKLLDSSVLYLDLVGETSTFYLKSSFFASYNDAHLGNYQRASQRLLQLKQLEELNYGSELRNFELAGIALLDGDFTRFDSLTNTFTRSYYQFSREEDDIIEVANILRNMKRKHGWVAGSLSAIAPGTGKMYAGKTKEGVVALMQVVALGGVAFEQYRRYGVEDPRFILFGGLFSVFYIGNIWGSALSVKIKRDEKLYDLHNRLLLDLHVPLRTLYN